MHQRLGEHPACSRIVAEFFRDDATGWPEWRVPYDQFDLLPDRLE
jgi:hypothetical protein